MNLAAIIDDKLKLARANLIQRAGEELPQQLEGDLRALFLDEVRRLIREDDAIQRGVWLLIVEQHDLFAAHNGEAPTILPFAPEPDGLLVDPVLVQLQDELAQLRVEPLGLARPSWGAWFMRLAYVTAQRATCRRKRVGALIVDDEHRVVSGGYNGAPRGLPDCLEVGCDVRMIDGRESCVTGDTVISKMLAGHWNSRHRTIREIYEMWQDGWQRRGMRLMKVRAANQHGALVAGRISDVWCNGIRPVFEVKTFLGRTVRATDNHEFLTPNGWQPLGALHVGLSTVALNGQKLVDDQEWLKSRYADGLSMEAIASLSNVSPSVVHRRMQKFGIERRSKPIWKKGEGGPGAGWNVGLTHGGSGGYKGRDVSPSVARSRARRYALADRCAVCGEAKKRLYVHHIDEDPLNDDLKNLVTLCNPCHELAHTPHAKRERIVFDRIVSIKPAGREKVYDLTIDEHHNFVGNGFVLHNCVRTIHAESNALDFAGPRAEGCLLYTTVIPCRPCALRIIQARIAGVYYHQFYRSQGTAETMALLESAGVRLHVMSPGDDAFARALQRVLEESRP